MIVELNNVSVKCKTGLYDWEQKLGVTLVFSIHIGLQQHAQTLDQTVDYTQLHQDILHYSTQNYELIEQLAQQLSQHILTKYPASKWVKLRICKPYLPIQNHGSSGSCIQVEVSK